MQQLAATVLGLLSTWTTTAVSRWTFFISSMEYNWWSYCSESPLSKIYVKDGQFVDLDGRVRLFRGINSVIKHDPWWENWKLKTIMVWWVTGQVWSWDVVTGAPPAAQRVGLQRHQAGEHVVGGGAGGGAGGHSIIIIILTIVLTDDW